MSQPIRIFLIILIVCLVFGGVLWGSSALKDMKDGGNDVVPVSGIDNIERGSDDPDAITVMLAGNLFCDSRYQKKMHNKTGGGFNFADTLEYVKPILLQSDLAIGNLETCISSSNPYSMDMELEDRKILSNAPASFLEALKNAGFNCLMLSSEHNCDFGKQGITETLDAVEKRGFYHTGLYDSRKDPHFILYENKGIRIAILSYTADFNGTDGSLTFEEQEYMLSKLDTGEVVDDISNAREAGAEYVIVYVNNGPKRSSEVTDVQKETLRMMAEAGADYVIGSRGYVLQRTGSVKRNGVRVRCAYSLGTFTGFRSDTDTRETAILRLKIRRDENGTVKAGKGKFIPCYMSRTWQGKKCVLLPEGTVANTDAGRELLEGHFASIRSTLGLDK